MLLAIAAAVALQAAPAPPPPPRVVRVRIERRADLRRLRGLDTNEVLRDGTLDVVVRSAADERRLEGLERVPRRPARIAQAPAPLPSGRTAYRDLDAYRADLERLAAEHPDRVRRVQIGLSVQGRPIEGLEIAQDVHADDGRPVNVLLGLQHAREWSTGEVVTEHAFELLQSTAPRVRRILERTRTFVFPVLNPDGYLTSRGGAEPLRRRNAAGVDLNRNHGAFWGGPGSSDNPLSENYRGPDPFSEPEAQALRAWSSQHHVMVINAVHSFGGMVLHQPGFSREDEPGLPRGTTIPYAEPMAALARGMAEEAGYSSGPAYSLYDVTGAAEDWNYFVQGAFAFTTELGHDGFQPPFAEAVGAQYPGLSRAFLLAAEAAGERSTHAVLHGAAPPGRELRLARDAPTSTSYVITGTDLIPRHEAARILPERVETTLTVPPSGRFTWHVNPSTRPVALLAGETEHYTLTCRDETREVAVAIGERRRLDLACGGGVIRIVSVRRAGRRLVVRLAITGRVTGLRATVGRHRARAARRFTIRVPRRSATLRITGRASSGETVSARRRVPVH